MVNGQVKLTHYNLQLVGAVALAVVAVNGESLAAGVNSQNPQAASVTGIRSGIAHSQLRDEVRAAQDHPRRGRLRTL